MASTEKPMSDIESLIRDFFVERFGVSAVKMVVAERDFDADGDDILRVTLVLQLSADHLESDQTRGLIRALRPKLAAVDEPGFPILSFMTPQEFKEVSTAA